MTASASWSLHRGAASGTCCQVYDVQQPHMNHSFFINLFCKASGLPPALIGSSIEFCRVALTNLLAFRLKVGSLSHVLQSIASVFVLLSFAVFSRTPSNPCADAALVWNADSQLD